MTINGSEENKSSQAIMMRIKEIYIIIMMMIMRMNDIGRDISIIIIIIIIIMRQKIIIGKDQELPAHSLFHP